MATPRAASFRALNALSQQSRRSLHMTGANSNPAATSSLAKDAHSLYTTRSLLDLRLECRKRNLKCAGEKNELVERLVSHDMLQTRAFSIAMKNINRKPFGAPSATEGTPVRHFNTSRANKAVGDSSTMDFAYFPVAYGSFAMDTSASHVPILPDNYSRKSNGEALEPTPVMKPEIHSIGGDTENTQGPSAMSEVLDNYSIEFDPYDLTSTVAKSAANAWNSEEAGTVKEVWNGFLDDLLGKKGPSVTKI